MKSKWKWALLIFAVASTLFEQLDDMKSEDENKELKKRLKKLEGEIEDLKSDKKERK